MQRLESLHSKAPVECEISRFRYGLAEPIPEATAEPSRSKPLATSLSTTPIRPRRRTNKIQRQNSFCRERSGTLRRSVPKLSWPRLPYRRNDGSCCTSKTFLRRATSSLRYWLGKAVSKTTAQASTPLQRARLRSPPLEGVVWQTELQIRHGESTFVYKAQRKHPVTVRVQRQHPERRRACGQLHRGAVLENVRSRYCQPCPRAG